MPAPPDPLNDEDLLGLDVPDILHALLAPMESPASYQQQQAHGPYAPLPQILHDHSLCAPNVDDSSVGNMIAPARPRTTPHLHLHSWPRRCRCTMRPAMICPAMTSTAPS